MRFFPKKVVTLQHPRKDDGELYTVAKETVGAASPAHFDPKKDSGSHCLLSALRG